MRNSNDKAWGERLCAAIVILIPIVWICGSVVFFGGTFGYRDASRFYYPLFDWTWSEWEAGRVPLWNPRENCGTPALADASASVFYPGQLLGMCPGSHASKCNAYIVIHLILAAVATYYVGRRWHLGRAAACLSAIAYAYGAPVLFNYSNVIYLVSAAWLPLGCFAIDRMIRIKKMRWAVVLAAVMSQMVLGGDPQTAYHLGILAALGVLFFGSKSGTVYRRFAAKLKMLLSAATATILLSAIQLLPSSEWTACSARAAYDRPRTVYEWASNAATMATGNQAITDQRSTDRQSNGGFASLWKPPDPDTHHENIYDFSIGPWRLIETLWPNVSGKMFPVNQRWMSAIPAESRVWAPSLYMGLIPTLLSLSAWRLTKGSTRRRWLSWSTLLAITASFGWYGIGWLIGDAAQLCSRESTFSSQVDGPVGGIYWLLVSLAPGYVYFRYPAKWLVIAAFGSAILGGYNLSSISLTRYNVIQFRLMLLLSVSIVAVIVLGLGSSLWTGILKNAPPDVILGPLNVSGSLRDAGIALVHTSVICLLCIWMMCRRLPPAMTRWGFVAVTVVELTAANCWLIVSVPVDDLETPSAASVAVRRGETGMASPWTGRTFRSHVLFAPESWKHSSAQDRLATSLRGDSDTLFLRMPLRRTESVQLSMVEVPHSIGSEDYQALFRVARRNSSYGEIPHPSVLRLLGTQYIVAPDSAWEQLLAEDKQAFEPMGGLPTLGMSWSLFRLTDHFPRTWIVHDMTVEKGTGRGAAQIEQRTQEIFFPGNKPRDFRDTAVIEVDSSNAQYDNISWPQPAQSVELCRVVLDTPQRVEIDVELHHEGLLILSDLYYPGWIARTQADQGKPAKTLEILCTNRVMRGVVLPVGRQRVVFEYLPWSFYVGAVISCITWCSLAIAAVARISN